MLVGGIICMLIVFLLLFFIIFLIIFLKVKIDVKYVTISNINQKNAIQVDYLIKICLCVAKKINILQFSINQEKVRRLQLIEKIKKNFKERKNNIKDYQIQNLKYIDYNIDKFFLKLNVGTENTIITSLITAIVGTSIGMFIANFIDNYNEKKHYFLINPIYKDKNIIDLKFNCIIYFDLVHIIYMLLKLREDRKNERTSNRRAYGNGYE